MHRLIGLVGMAVLMALAFLFSTNRRAIRKKTVAWGLGLQIVFAFLVMRWEYGRWIFHQAGEGVNWVLNYFGVMQFIIKIAAVVMTRLMGASGAESLNVAASIFMGQTEAPLTIRPFLPEVTH